MEKNVIVLEYNFFLNISEERRLKMLKENLVEWRVYIPRQKQENLTEYEKKRLKGFVVTDVPPVKVINFELFPSENPKLIESIKIAEKNVREAEKQKLRHHVPRKIGMIYTKKRGGR